MLTPTQCSTFTIIGNLLAASPGAGNAILKIWEMENSDVLIERTLDRLKLDARDVGGFECPRFAKRLEEDAKAIGYPGCDDRVALEMVIAALLTTRATIEVAAGKGQKADSITTTTSPTRFVKFVCSSRDRDVVYVNAALVAVIDEVQAPLPHGHGGTKLTTRLIMQDGHKLGRQFFVEGSMAEAVQALSEGIKS